MSATTIRHPKGTPEGRPERGAVPFVWALLDSSVGAKITVALTGLGLVTFALFHMIGNLKVFQGPAAINGYAYFLKHDLGMLIWVARAGLLGIFVLHLTLAIRLKLRSAAARPIGYAHPGHVQATVASRTMLWSGVVVGLFVLFHLAHFTFGWVHGAEVPDPKTGQKVFTNYLDLKGTPVYDAETGQWGWRNFTSPADAKDPLKHDVYSMVVVGFTTPWLAVLYLVAQTVLFLHLWHGVQSSFQTLGLKNSRFAPAVRLLGRTVAAVIFIGNVGIVVGVWAGYAPPLYPTA
jgi:succinate dehydrogenase / fumarate reductase cytochrome b subunit